MAVHDGARPCLSPETLNSAIADARKHGSAAVAVPVTDTVKRSDSEGYIATAVSRDGLWAMQTPQVFPYDRFADVPTVRWVKMSTDDASMVDRLGDQGETHPRLPDKPEGNNPRRLGTRGDDT